MLQLTSQLKYSFVAEGARTTMANADYVELVRENKRESTLCGRGAVVSE